MADKFLRAGIAAYRAGDLASAASLFSRVVKADPRSAEGWFWLAKVAPSADKKVYCFRRVLKIDPSHEEARQELRSLGYLKPKPEAPPPAVEKATSESVSLFSVDPEEIPDERPPLPDFEDEEEFEEETPAEEEAQDKEDEEEAEVPEKEKKRGPRVFLLALVIGACLSIFGLGALFFFRQPDLLSALEEMVVSPTPTLAPTPSPTPTLAPTPTILPFSALEMVSYAPDFEESECSFEVPEGVDVACGFVTVPEDRYGDANDTIRLAVALYYAVEPEEGTYPTIYLQGGPGQDAIIPMSENYELTIAPFIQSQDFILFDQRGMGLSEPRLDCPDLKTVFQEDSDNEIPVHERETRYLEAFGECRDTLIGKGANLSAYTTLASAHDVKDILLALDYDKANLFGVSYGTRLAQVVMREHPEVVHAAALDSVLPVDAKIYNESAANSQYALSKLFEGCAADPACASAYPDLEGEFLSLIEELDQTPMRATVYLSDNETYGRNVDGLAFMNTTLWALRQPELLSTVPQSIARAKMGDANLLGTILAYPSQAVMDINLGAYLSINCREQVYATSAEEVGRDLAEYPDTEAVGLGWVYGDPALIFELCDTWQIERTRPDENMALSSDIPTLLMTGEYDSTTPPRFAEQVAAGLSRATMVEFPGQGHAVSFTQTSACPIEILGSFLQAPDAAIDTSCIAEMPVTTFSTPYTGDPPLVLVQVSSEEAGVTTVVPEEWKDLGAGFYYRDGSSWDVTQVGAQKVSLGFDSWLAWLVENFNGIGLDSYPIKTKEENINGLVWNFYTSTAQEHPVDLAFAQDGYDTIMVVMMSHADEHDVFFEQLFLEMLNNTIILEPEGEVEE